MLLKAFYQGSSFYDRKLGYSPTYLPGSPEVQLLARSPGETPTTSRHKRQLAVF